MADDAVRIEGLAALRRDLRGMTADVRRDVRLALKGGAELVARDAGPLAARGTRPIPADRRPRTRLADSFRAGTSGDVAVVRSRLAHAGVHEFGGTISPRGTPIKIKATPAATRALERNEERIVDAVGDAFDAVALRHGWT
jgi:hypothetical protein